MRSEGELSKTMKACMDFCRAHQDQILRFPGGFWGSRGGGDPWFGTTTVRWWSSLMLAKLRNTAAWRQACPKPPHHIVQKSRRLPKRKRMTIVAGFCGTGFGGSHSTTPYVMLGADSDEVGSAMTSSVRKIEVITGEGFKILLAGSGNGDFIDLAIQHARTDVQGPFTLESIRDQIEDIVTQIYKDRIDEFPPHEQNALEFSLLGAIWAQGEGVQMIKIRRSLGLIATRPTTIGAGSDLATYIIENFHFPGIQAYPATRLMVYLLMQVKKYAPDCGGTSQVVYIDGDGNVTELWPSTIAQHELSISTIMEGGGKWLFYYADPMGFGYDMRAVDGAIDMAVGFIKADIRTKMGGMAAARATAAANTSPALSSSVSPSISESASASPSVEAPPEEEKKD